MERIFIENLGKIKNLKKKLETALKIKINITKEAVEIQGKDVEGYSEYIAGLVLKALDMGFSLDAALMLKNEDYMLEKINLKKHLRPSRLKTVKGRIIGEKGRTKELISELTDCAIAIKDYDIGIIGKTADVDIARHALISLIQGAPHSHVYSYLEKSRKLRKFKLEEEESLL